MTHLDEIALRRAELLKRVRSQVRLNHSIAADAELNDILPLAEKAFNAAVQRGVLLDVADVLDAIEAGDVAQD